MKCPNCNRAMTLLFISWVCDTCNPPGPQMSEAKATPFSVTNKDQRGFVVLRRERTLPCEEYVFRTRADAERWRELTGLLYADIREVVKHTPFSWQASRGTVRGVILADRLHELHIDYSQKPQPDRAFVVGTVEDDDGA